MGREREAAGGGIQWDLLLERRRGGLWEVGAHGEQETQTPLGGQALGEGQTLQDMAAHGRQREESLGTGTWSLAPSVWDARAQPRAQGDGG